MRTAYLIFAHHRPAQLMRLIRRLDEPGATFHVHLDGGAPAGLFDEPIERFSSTPNVTLVPRRKIKWGDVSLALAQLDCLRSALAAEPGFDTCVLLSGADYPIKSFAERADYFSRRRGRSVVEVWALPSERWQREGGGAARYRHWNIQIGRRFVPILGPQTFSNAVLDRAWNAVTRRIEISRAFPMGMRPHGGSGWFSLTHEAAAHVDAFVRAHPDYVRFFRWARIPDEMLIQSVLMNSPFAADVVNASMHHIAWPSAVAPSPRVLSSDDLPALAATDAIFARKFDEAVDPHVLDMIDDRLLNL